MAYTHKLTIRLLSLLLTTCKLASAEGGEDFFHLIVDKTTLKAYLQTLPHDLATPKIVSEFHIAIGKSLGDKKREGDHKTPEGIYFPGRHIDSSRLLPAKHGHGAIPVNYPNAMDRLKGKTGYGIWLHGAGNDDRIAGANVTEGCIAFYNSEILLLQEWLKPHKSIISVVNGRENSNQPQILNEIYYLTQNWIEAWQKRKVEIYSQFYSSRFTSGRHKTKNSYTDYKKRVFASYKKIDLTMEQIRIISHPKYAVAIMNQDFHGDNRFHSQGAKILYWQQEAEGWKIIKEVFDTVTFSTLAYQPQDIIKLNKNLTSHPRAISPPLSQSESLTAPSKI